MKKETFFQAQRIIERIEHSNKLIQELRRTSQMLSNTSNEGLTRFLAVLNEMNNGEYLIGEIVDQIIERYQKTIHEYEEQLEAL